MKTFWQRMMDRFIPDSIPTTDQLSLHYAEMTDEAFRLIDPNELTPSARQCHQDEARKRGSMERNRKT